MSSDLDGADAFDKVLDRAIDEAAQNKVMRDKVYDLEAKLSTSQRETESARSALRNLQETNKTKAEAEQCALGDLWKEAERLFTAVQSPGADLAAHCSALHDALQLAAPYCGQTTI